MGKSDEFKKSDLSDELRRLRVNAGYTQIKVAEYLNIDRSTYTKYENGREPDLNTLKKLAKLYDISLAELISGRYSENAGKTSAVRAAEISLQEQDDFYPLSSEEKKLISYFRSCSRPSTILRFARNLYHDDLFSSSEDEENK